MPSNDYVVTNQKHNAPDQILQLCLVSIKARLDVTANKTPMVYCLLWRERWLDILVMDRAEKRPTGDRSGGGTIRSFCPAHFPPSRHFRKPLWKRYGCVPTGYERNYFTHD